MQTRRHVIRAALLVVLVACLAGCWSAGSSADQGAVTADSPATASPATASPATAHFDVLGLGDSVTAGTACDCKTFVQRYAALVADRTGAQVSWKNDGVGGQTSSGLLAELHTASTSKDVGAADIVVITIGANDLASELQSWQDDGCPTACMTADLPAMSRNITGIVARVHQLAGDRHVLIAVTDYWNVFEDGQVADQDYGHGFAAWSDHLTRLTNDAICSAAKQATACVDLYAPFNGDGDRDPTSLLAADGDHPNAAGHAVIAGALAAAVMPTVAAP